MVAALEGTIAGWLSVLAGVMQREADRKPLGRGPLAGGLPSCWAATTAITQRLAAANNAMEAAACEHPKHPTRSLLRDPLSPNDAEVDFWRARSAVLGGLAEQLALPSVGRMIAAAEAGSEDRNLLTAFRSQLAELTKLAAEVGEVQAHAVLNAAISSSGSCCHIFSPYPRRATTSNS